jgi:gallate decarboxylase subunit D
MNRIVIGTGETTVICSFELIGEDLLISVTGGTHHHIGAIALGVPRPSLKLDGTGSATVSILALTGHKDDEVARRLAHEIAARLQRTTIVVAGLHIDNATPEQIKSFVANAGRVTGEVCRLVQPLSNPQTPPHQRH